MRNTRLAPGFLAAVVLLLASPASAQLVWTIPGIVNAGGLNNTRFLSDVSVTNPGTTATQVTISFIPSAAPNARNVTLNAGETVVYRNVVDSMFGTSGAGALSISSDQSLLLRARTYNTASSGTYGVALPVYEADRLLTAGEIGDSLWVSQDASGSSGYRSNIAVVFPDQGGGAATVTVYDADGNERGRKDYALDSAGLQQFSAGSFAGAVSVGRAQIHVTRGRAAGYSVVVDNVTGDSSLFTFEDLPGGRQDVLINGVARANGRNATFFRTDGRFYNATDVDATVTVSFHASGNSNPSPVTAPFTLQAGKVRDVVDVLKSLLGLPVGSSGALRFKSDVPVAILCRTSNVDPTGMSPGTFGAQQKPVPVLSFLTSADAGASITGIRQDASYRTNVGFAAGGDGARYTMTMMTAGGASVATATASLGGWGWTQPNVQDLFPGTSIPADATLRIKVTDGSLDVYDSSIDNASGDPVVTPIAALPVAIPSSATIGPTGGSIQSSDGRLTLRIPAGAVAQTTAFSFQETTNGAPQGTGPGYQVAPSGITFSRPAFLTLAYGRNETEGSSAEALIIARRSGADWTILGGGTVDPVRHTLTVPLNATAPAARAQKRSLAADGSTELAAARSWELVPTGKRAVVERGRLRFSVYSVAGGGSSSSSVADSATGILSRSPYEVDAEWFVNGERDGNQLWGVILHEGAGGTLSVQYLAPNCPPRDNPVTITAFLRNKSPILRYLDRARGSAIVKILPRDWYVSVTWIADWKCIGSNDILDYMQYNGGFEFSLDESLKMTQTKPTGSSVARGTASPCPGSGHQTVTRTDEPAFQVSLGGGTYYPDTETFDVSLNLTLPLRPGYFYIETDKTSGSSESGVLSKPWAGNLNEGKNVDPTYDGVKGEGLYLLSFEVVKVDKPCP